MLGIIIGIGVFMFLVIIHELGHFWAAKKSGVQVLEFGIGIPPKVATLRKDRKGTAYTLNLLPLGGFVRLKGENPKEKQDFHAPDSFISAKIRQKVIILLGGITMNLLFAWIVFTVLFTHGIQPISIIPENALATESRSYLMPSASFLQEEGFLSGKRSAGPVQIQEIAPDSLAQEVGLQSGDIILNINGRVVDGINIGSVLQRYIDDDITIVYARGDTKQSIETRCPPDNCVLGILLAQESNVEIQPIKFPFPQSAVAGLHEIGAQAKLTFFTLGNLVTNLVSLDNDRISSSLNNLTGPVGAIKFGDALRQSGGWIAYLAFAAIISLALALFNVLPIPALDGGRLLGVLLQWIARLKPEKYFTIEGYINVIFFVLLLGLGIYIILKDLVRFWGVNVPFLG